MTHAAEPHQVVQGCPSTMGDDCQLNTTTLIRHAARTHPDQEIVYRTVGGGWDRYTYADCYARVWAGAARNARHSCALSLTSPRAPACSCTSRRNCMRCMADGPTQIAMGTLALA